MTPRQAAMKSLWLHCLQTQTERVEDDALRNDSDNLIYKEQDLYHFMLIVVKRLSLLLVSVFRRSQRESRGKEGVPSMHHYPTLPYKMAAVDQTEPVYCLCRKPYDQTQFMIQCDKCQDWFHGR